MFIISICFVKVGYTFYSKKIPFAIAITKGISMKGRIYLSFLMKYKTRFILSAFAARKIKTRLTVYYGFF